MKPCAHVVCKVCVDELVRAVKQCIVCDHKLRDEDIVELKREGAFFHSGHMVACKKKGLSRSFPLMRRILIE